MSSPISDEPRSDTFSSQATGIISATTIKPPAWTVPVGADADFRVIGGNFAFSPTNTPVFFIFEVLNVKQHVGLTYTLDSTVDKILFQQTVDYLTNGDNGGILFHLNISGANPDFANPDFSAGSSASYPKREFNQGYPGADLRGFTIEGLDLHVDRVDAQPWYGEIAISVDITFVIRGKFPWSGREPPPPEGPSPPVDSTLWPLPPWR